MQQWSVSLFSENEAFLSIEPISSLSQRDDMIKGFCFALKKIQNQLKNGSQRLSQQHAHFCSFD